MCPNKLIKNVLYYDDCITLQIETTHIRAVLLTVTLHFMSTTFFTPAFQASIIH